MDLFLKILAFVFIVPGFLMVFSARYSVVKFKLEEKMKVGFEHEMSEEELSQYKFNKALVNVKMLGMLVALPGLVLVIIAFR